jgi:hypothetical protein
VDVVKDFTGFPDAPVLIAEGARGDVDVVCVGFNTCVWVLDIVTSACLTIYNVPEPRRPVVPADLEFVLPDDAYSVEAVESLTETMQHMFEMAKQRKRLPRDSRFSDSFTFAAGEKRVAVMQPAVQSRIEAIHLSPDGSCLAVAKTDAVYVLALDGSVQYNLALADTVSLLYTENRVVCVHETGELNVLDLPRKVAVTVPQLERATTFIAPYPIQWNVCAARGTQLFVGAEGVIRLLDEVPADEVPQGVLCVLKSEQVQPSGSPLCE